MKILFKILLFIAFLHSITFAQLKTSSSVGARYVVPMGTVSDFYDSGWGITGTSYFGVTPLLDIIVEGSWHTFVGKELTFEDNVLGTDDLSVLGFTAGARLNLLGMVGLGVKGGYFFDDIHEWAIQPFAEVSLLMFSLGAEYRKGEDVDWTAIYLNVTF